MFLYNVTIGIERASEAEWLDWMRSKHIPAVMKTGMFTDTKMYKVLHENVDDTVSYSVQYFAATLHNVQQYLENFAPSLIEEHRQRFKDRHVAFRTLLEEI